MNNKVSFYTLGCKLNFSETSTIAREFLINGYKKVSFDSYEADYYVINTCTVTENANKECRKLINKIKKNNNKSYILVTGCYAQLKPNEILEIQGVNAVVSNSNKNKIFDILNDKKDNFLCHSEIDSNNFYESYSLNDRTRTFLKIQDGCDYKCTFCTIPMARGESRNQSISKTIMQVKTIIEKGVNEIVLTGVNIGDFGKSTNETFFSLVKKLEKIDSKIRIRISSIEPNLLTKEIIDFISISKNFVPHFHIPLQSGSNKILKLMRRRYDNKKYYNCINYLSKTIPDVCIGADVIVGFPGETEIEFLESFEFIKKLNLSYLHVFSYSNRENTKSIKMKKHNSVSVIKNRSKILREYSKKINLSFKQSQMNKNRDVLFESINNGYLTGLTDNYIKVTVPGDVTFLNSVIKTKLIKMNNDLVLGKVIN